MTTTNWLPDIVELYRDLADREPIPEKTAMEKFTLNTMTKTGLAKVTDVLLPGCLKPPQIIFWNERAFLKCTDNTPPTYVECTFAKGETYTGEG